VCECPPAPKAKEPTQLGAAGDCCPSFLLGNSRFGATAGNREPLPIVSQLSADYGVGLVAQQRFQIAAASNDAIDHYIVTVDPIQKDVLAHRKAAHARPKLVSPTASLRMLPEQSESFAYGLDQAISDLEAAALEKDVKAISSRSASACGARRCPISRTWRNVRRRFGGGAAV
jgi:hypothetical protein